MIACLENPVDMTEISRVGSEVKRISSHGITPSMKSAISDLKLKQLDVIHEGDETFQLDKKVRVVTLSRLLKDINPLR